MLKHCHDADRRSRHCDSPSLGAIACADRELLWSRTTRIFRKVDWVTPRSLANSSPPHSRHRRFPLCATTARQAGGCPGRNRNRCLGSTDSADRGNFVQPESCRVTQKCVHLLVIVAADFLFPPPSASVSRTPLRRARGCLEVQVRTPRRYSCFQYKRTKSVKRLETRQLATTLRDEKSEPREPPTTVSLPALSFQPVSSCGW